MQTNRQVIPSHQHLIEQASQCQQPDDWIVFIDRNIRELLKWSENYNQLELKNASTELTAIEKHLVAMMNFYRQLVIGNLIGTIHVQISSQDK